MNKKIKNSLLILALAVLTPVCMFAAIYTYDAVVTIGTPTITILHTAPEHVPPINKEMVVVGTVTFSESGNLNSLDFTYTLQGSSAVTESVTNIVPISATSYRFVKAIEIEQT